MPKLSVVEPPGASAVERLVEDYLMSCRAKGLSPNTVNNSYGYRASRHPAAVVFRPRDRGHQGTRQAGDGRSRSLWPSIAKCKCASLSCGKGQAI